MSSSPKSIWSSSPLVFSSVHQTRLKKELVSSENISYQQFLVNAKGSKLTPGQGKYIYSDELLYFLAELNGKTISCFEIPESLQETLWT